MAEESARFAWERAIQTIAVGAMSAMVVWAGTAVVNSRQDVAVLQEKVGRVEGDVRGIQEEMKKLREAVDGVRYQMRNMNQADERREQRTPTPPAWAPPPAPYSPPRQPMDSTPLLRPQQGGR